MRWIVNWSGPYVWGYFFQRLYVAFKRAHIEAEVATLSCQSAPFFFRFGNIFVAYYHIAVNLISTPFSRCDHT